MIETSVYTTIGPLVSNRCYPLQMPQNPTFPAVVYTRIANTPFNVLDRPPTIDQVRLQIDVYAKTYTAVKALGKQVRDAMESATFKATLQTDDDFFEAETDLYRVSLDFYIFERI